MIFLFQRLDMLVPWRVVCLLVTWFHAWFDPENSRFFVGRKKKWNLPWYKTCVCLHIFLNQGIKECHSLRLEWWMFIMDLSVYFRRCWLVNDVYNSAKVFFRHFHMFPRHNNPSQYAFAQYIAYRWLVLKKEAQLPFFACTWYLSLWIQ